MTLNHIRTIAQTQRDALLNDVVPFWARHSLDREFGGYVTCLDRHGQWYGTDKAVWLQGRQVWLFATLYSEVERRPEWLDIARLGYEFLIRHCFAPSGKMYFSVTRDGRPLRMRRYVYSEVFGILAFVAMARATGDESIRQRAIALYQQWLRYLRTPGLLEPKVDPQVRPGKALSPLMCLLNVSDAMLAIDPAGPYERIIDETIAEILRDFFKRDRDCVLEAVGPNGEILDGPEGRVMNPGHAIECAWFMLDVVRRRKGYRRADSLAEAPGAAVTPFGSGDASDDLIRSACKIIDISVDRGTDRQYGGLLYFIDVEGKPPVQLEHDMKLWWPHNEAMIATLMAYSLCGHPKYEKMHDKLSTWAMSHFPDPEFGEWYGYLHRDGSVSTPLKGGPWKGAFHVPRAMLYCWKLAEAMSARTAS